MRREFANICSKLVKKDPTAVVMLGDISHFLLRETQQAAPDRFFNIGICEQSMVSMASGMAIEGMRPILHTIAPFLVERSYEQIKDDLGYQNVDVTLVSVGGSYDYADLGCTHHCYGDIALMRCVPNMEVYAPGTPAEFQKLFEQTWGNGSPKYFRLTTSSHTCHGFNIIPGDLNVLRESKDGRYAFVTGHILDDVMEDSDIGIIYATTLSHISDHSKEIIRNTIKDSKKVFTVENHFKNGGLGDLISEAFEIPITRIGLEREFITSYGSYDELRKECGMDKHSILQKLKQI